MNRAVILGLMFGGLIPPCQSSFERTALAQERTRIAPASNGVEIEEIQIVRRSALGTVKGANLTNMQLGLWFAANWKEKEGDSPPLIHLQELSTIEDDTGHVLSTEKRLKQIEPLRGEAARRHLEERKWREGGTCRKPFTRCTGTRREQDQGAQGKGPGHIDEASQSNVQGSCRNQREGSRPS